MRHCAPVYLRATLSTFARDPTTGDLLIPRVLVADPAECARQQCVDVLGLWQGEWLLDQGIGFPWGDLLGIKIVSTAKIQALLEQAIRSVTGVVGVTVQSTFDRARRAFAYNFQAPLNSGAILSGGSNQPFRVTPVGGQA